MKAIGLTLVREATRLHYPIELVRQSFKALDGIVYALDVEDPELEGFILRHQGPQVHFATVRWGRDGNASMRRALEAGLAVAQGRGATHVLYLEADECMWPSDVNDLMAQAPDVAWLQRLQFWQDMKTIRLDWTLALPRWARVEALRSAAEWGDGDAGGLFVKPSYAVAQFPHWPIYHLSRVGSPRMIAKRRRAIAEFYDPSVIVPDAYDFVTRRYEDWRPGKMPPPVGAEFASYFGASPNGVSAWVDRDNFMGSKP